jgi:hypothetical protein
LIAWAIIIFSETLVKSPHLAPLNASVRWEPGRLRCRKREACCLLPEINQSFTVLNRTCMKPTRRSNWFMACTRTVRRTFTPALFQIHCAFYFRGNDTSRHRSFITSHSARKVFRQHNLSRWEVRTSQPCKSSVEPSATTLVHHMP